MKNEYRARFQHPLCVPSLLANLFATLFLIICSGQDASAQCFIPRNDTVFCIHPLAQLTGTPDTEFWPDTTMICATNDTIQSITFQSQNVDSIYDCSPTQDIAYSIVRTYRAVYKDAVEDINDTTWVYAINLRSGNFICPEGIDSIQCGSNGPNALSNPALRAPMYGIAGVDTIPLDGSDVLCKVAVSMQEDVWTGFCNDMWIERTWRLKSCGVDTTCVDTIVVYDDLAPEISFGDPKLTLEEHTFDGVLVELLTDTIGTGHSCDGQGSLPYASVFDSCSTEEEITVFISSPTAGFGILEYQGDQRPSLFVSGVSPGKHLVIYKAKDACHQISADSIVLVVADRTPAVAVCHDAVNLTLTNVDDFTLMKASSMDAESYDNCHLHQILARRTDWLEACNVDTNAAPGENSINDFYRHFADWVANDPGLCPGVFELGFASEVPFCCDDVGKEIMVEILVIDQHCNVDRCWGMVNVESKVAPVKIEALLDDTISCEAYTANYRQDVLAGDLAALNAHFGKYVFDEADQDQWTLNNINCDGTESTRDYWDGLLKAACATELIESVEEPSVDCDGGFIKRSWEAVIQTHDGQDTIAVATQKIFIKQCPMGTNILPPEPEVEFFACDITYGLDGNTTFITDPPDVSAAISECRQLGVGYFDKVFDVVAGRGCKKVLRTWCVMDWCDPEVQNATDWNHIAGLPGVKTYTQKIIVSDTIAPTITMPSVSATNRTINCSASLETTVSISDACGATARWSVQSLSGETVAQGTGETASVASLSPGGYILRFVVTDGCGNEASQMTTFNVSSDAQPSVVAHSMLTAQLTPTDTDGDNTADQGIAEVWAQEFNSSSAPPCGGDPGNLIYLLRIDDGAEEPVVPNNDQTAIQFTCADKVGDGIVLLQFWVKDTLTNTADFTYVFVDLDDNSNICSGSAPPSSAVSGVVFTEGSQQVANVKVTAESEKGSSTALSDVKGSFSLMVPAQQSVRLVPEKNSDYGNGISTLDLVKIQKHILGIQRLTSPYQLIAADANRDKKINPIDIIQLRRLIIGKSDRLPSNSSWRFVDAQYNFASPLEAHQEDFPEFVTAAFQKDPIKIIGIKVGDLDGNVVASRARESRGMEVLVQDQFVQKGSSAMIAMETEQMLSGYQMDLLLDPDKLELVSIISDDPLFAEKYCNLDRSSARISWSSVNKGAPLQLMLEVRALETVHLSDAMAISEARIPSQGVTPSEGEASLKLKFRSDAFTVEQNAPNPFGTFTQVEFDLPEADFVTLMIYDGAGRVIQKVAEFFPAGKNRIEIEGSDLPQGIMNYTLSSRFGSKSKRMIHLQ